MIVWNGRLLTMGCVSYYNLHFVRDCRDLGHYPPTHPGGLLCHVDSMWRSLKDINHGDAINTWGHQSPGTDQMALAILGWTFCHFDSDLYSYVLGRMFGWDRIADLMLNYYKPFADEVLANLPDTWTMTELDVLEWLNKKEKENFLKHQTAANT